jgi:hypothetical protein
MRALFDTLGGLWQLALLGFKTRFRFGGPYWQWRMDTAFGDDPERRPPLRQRLFATLEYARWVHRMKRSRR